jgi:hypothetical protein
VQEPDAIGRLQVRSSIYARVSHEPNYAFRDRGNLAFPSPDITESATHNVCSYMILPRLICLANTAPHTVRAERVEVRIFSTILCCLFIPHTTCVQFFIKEKKKIYCFNIIISFSGTRAVLFGL